MRPLSIGDAASLAALMLAAYRGTADDEGETEEDARREIAATLDGRHGNYLGDSSLGLWCGDRLISAVVTTLYEDTPLFDFCMTAPEFKRSGYCRFLMRQSQDVMRRQGWGRAHLYVTAANTPASGLYRQLGFVGATPRPPDGR